MTSGHFSIINIFFLNLNKGFSNLEPAGQGRGIIMGVTRLLLLGPFYTIQMQFYLLFAVYCIQYMKIRIIFQEESKPIIHLLGIIGRGTIGPTSLTCLLNERNLRVYC